MNHQLLSSLWVATVSMGVFPTLVQATPAATSAENPASMTVRRSLQLVAQEDVDRMIQRTEWASLSQQGSLSQLEIIRPLAD